VLYLKIAIDKNDIKRSTIKAGITNFMYSLKYAVREFFAIISLITTALKKPQVLL